jgi:hypothetical protein
VPRPRVAGLGRIRLPVGFLPFYAAVGALGCAIAGVGFQLSRSGHSLYAARGLFWLGLALIYLPAVLRSLQPGSRTSERLALVALAGLLLYLVKILHDPFVFGQPDEYTHAINTQHILQTGRLFSPNTILPESPYYPGLASTTAAVASVTGLSVFSAGMIVIGAARVALLVALFVLVRTVTLSDRIAALAALFYCANPNFLFFSAQFSYIALSVPLFVATLACIVLHYRSAASAARPAGRSASAYGATALLLTAAVAMTHHLTSFVLASLLAALTVVTARRGRSEARYGVFALVAGVMAVSWLVVVAPLTIDYLRDIFEPAVPALARIFTGLQAPRRPFSGTGTAAWRPGVDEGVLALLNVLIVSIAVVAGSYAFFRRRALGRRRISPETDALTLLLVVGAVGWVAIYGLRLAPEAWEIANRTSDFLYLGAALLCASVAEVLVRRRPRRSMKIAVSVVASAVMFGGNVIGFESSVRLPRPVQVRAENGTVLQPESAAFAAWAAGTLSPRASLAADGTAGRLLLLDGFRRVFASATGTAVEVMRNIPGGQPWERDFFADNAVDYLELDRRRDSSFAELGVAFHRARPFDPPESWVKPRVRRGFDALRGATRVYDSGNIVAYDVRDVRGGRPFRRTLVADAPARRRPSGAQHALLSDVIAAEACILLVLALWRRGGRRAGPGRGRQRAATLATIAAPLLLVAAAIAGPLPAPAAGAVAVGLLALPGIAVIRLLFGRVDFGRPDIVFLVPLVSCAVLMCSAVLLDALGVRLDRWAFTAAVSLVLLAPLARRPGPAAPMLSRRRRPLWRIALAALLVAAAATAVAVSIAYARTPTRTTAVKGYTALWTGRRGPNRIAVGVQSAELRRETVRVVVRRGRRVIAARRLVVEPGAARSWQVWAPGAAPVVVKLTSIVPAPRPSLWVSPQPPAS